MAYHFSNILGHFIIDNSFKEIRKAQKESKDVKIEEVPQQKLSIVLELFKDKKYFSEFYNQNIVLSKQALKKSVTEDQLIIQAISNVQELDKICNILTKRLREWYSWYHPELCEEVKDNEKFAELVLTEKRGKESMGADLDKPHLDEMNLLAKEIGEMFQLRKTHEAYLQKVLLDYCPNLVELAGVTISAKLIELGKSLKHLALLPASTIQLLGAEKALFRHIKTGARSPKYGVIFAHPLIQNSKRSDRGKASRMLADKLSLCARLDFFKGEFKAKEFRKELEEKLR